MASAFRNLPRRSRLGSPIPGISAVYTFGTTAGDTIRQRCPVRLKRRGDSGTPNYSTLAANRREFGPYRLRELFNGAIDDVRIYNRALSAADVAQLYASGEAIIRKPANNLGLVGYWNFNEGHVDDRA